MGDSKLIMEMMVKTQQQELVMMFSLEKTGNQSKASRSLNFILEHQC